MESILPLQVVGRLQSTLVGKEHIQDTVVPCPFLGIPSALPSLLRALRVFPRYR